MRVVLACACNSKPSKQQVLLEPFTRKKWKDGMFEQNQSMTERNKQTQKGKQKNNDIAKNLSQKGYKKQQVEFTDLVTLLLRRKLMPATAQRAGSMRG